MSTSPFYESDRALAEYLLFHYGSPDELLPWKGGPTEALGYPSRCVSECLDVSRVIGRSRIRALDLGCAVGRSTFELARHCSEVIGIDASHRFILAAQRLQREGCMPYAYAEEGMLTRPTMAKVPEEIDRTRVAFEVGDAQALHEGLGVFDVVLLANLMDRLPRPRRCLAVLPTLVRSGGQLILTTPCTWMEDYTSRSEWLGGYEEGGRVVRTLDTIRSVLEPQFVLNRVLDLPFLIREHARKFQWSVALATVWTRA